MASHVGRNADAWHAAHPYDAADWILCYDAMHATREVSAYGRSFTGLDGR